MVQTVNVTQLQTNLSDWLDRVKAGEEVLVNDHHLPIAKLVPVAVDNQIEAEELQLAIAGLVQLPSAKLPESFWEMPAPHASQADVVAAIRAERDGH